MGNSSNSNAKGIFHKRDLEAPKKVLDKFSKQEQNYLLRTFTDLAIRSPGPTIDRTTFLQNFRLPGLHGEQLFNIFDFNKTGTIDYTEFLTGLSLCFKAPLEEKLHFLFQIYDISSDGKVSKSELMTMLLQVPEVSLMGIAAHCQGSAEERPNEPVNILKDKDGAELKVDASKKSGSEAKISLIDTITLNIFEKYDKGRKGYLMLEEFMNWAKLCPEIVMLLDSVFEVVIPKTTNVSTSNHSSPKTSNRASQDDLKRLDSALSSSNIGVNKDQAKHPGHRNSIFSVGSLGSNHSHNHFSKGGSGKGNDAIEKGLTSLENSSIGIFGEDDAITKQGTLIKIGKQSSMKVSRHYVLRDNILCYYSTRSDQSENQVPKGIIMLQGCFIYSLPDSDQRHSYTGKTMYGLEIKLPFHGSFSQESDKISSSVSLADLDKESPLGKSLRKVFYVKNRQERDDWVQKLIAASKDRKFDSLYVKNEEIGSGKFATVYRCVAKATGQEYACKLMSKKSMSVEEAELLRTEIAILRILHHDNIIRLVDVLENESNLFIVMELVRGGELFSFIIGRSRFTEKEAYVLLSQLLNGVDYLHKAGIIHRDLKPENILLDFAATEEKTKPKVLSPTTVIKLTDFGLSRLVFPNQILDMPCGTVSYVAPEVLDEEAKGYTVSADIWSIGVMTYLVLSGRLPFDSDDTEAVRQQVLRYDSSNPKHDLFRGDVWKSIDSRLIDLVRIMLASKPDDRRTASELKEHEWLVFMKKEIDVRKA